MRRLLLLMGVVVAVALVAGGRSGTAESLVTQRGSLSQPSGTVTRIWGYDKAYYQGVYGLGLNDRGEVIWNWKDAPQYGDHAYLWRRGKTTLLGKNYASVNGLNNRSQVIGWGGVDGGGYLWKDGTFRSLLEGSSKTPALRALHPHNVVPVAINSHGQVVGAVEGSNPDRTTSWQHPFLWENGTMIDLGLPPGAISGHAAAINERGQVAGTYLDRASDEYRPFLWRNGKLEALGTEEVNPSAVTELGQVFASAFDGTDYLWQNGRWIALGRLGGRPSDATAINNRGQVVGWFATARSARHAFLWQNGKLRDLGTLGGHRSQALALNDRGQVVGRSQLPNRSWHAFLWQHGKMTDLGSFRPRAINNNGQILALNATCRQKTCQLLLWTPNT